MGTHKREVFDGKVFLIVVMEVHVHVDELLGFVDLETLSGFLFLYGVFVDLLLKKFLDLLDYGHTAFFASGFASPDEDFPKQHLVSSAGDVLGILKSLVQNVFVENGEDVFFNACQ